MYCKNPFKVKNEITDVYIEPLFSESMKNKKEGFEKNRCYDSSLNPQDCAEDISKNMFSLKTVAKYQNYNETVPEIDENYKHLENEINKYIIANNKSKDNDMIDNYGNLLLNNTDIAPTKLDGMMEDSKKNLIQQNNMYIIGSFLVTTILIGVVISRWL